mgnify:CR=1 FL=1
MFKKLTLITALASSPIAANADLLEFDWQTQGDGDVTLAHRPGMVPSFRRKPESSYTIS